MTLIRVLRSAGLTVSHTFYVDETPTDATGAVTWTLRRLDGTLVATDVAAGPVSHEYTAAIPAQANLDALSLAWTGTVAGSPVTTVDYVEVVGGFLFGLAEARNAPPPLSSVKYPSTTLAAKRVGVETECEEICGQAFVPRFARVTLSGPNSGNPWLSLPRQNVRSVRSVTIDGSAFTGYEVAPEGLLYSPAGWVGNAVGRPSIVVEFEHGMDYPPADITDACIQRLRSRLTFTDSGVPQRALSFSIGDGGVYRLSTPSGQRTGIPDVDAAYERWTPVEAGFA